VRLLLTVYFIAFTQALSFVSILPINQSQFNLGFLLDIYWLNSFDYLETPFHRLLQLEQDWDNVMQIIPSIDVNFGNLFGSFIPLCKPDIGSI